MKNKAKPIRKKKITKKFSKNKWKSKKFKPRSRNKKIWTGNTITKKKTTKFLNRCHQKF